MDNYKKFRFDLALEHRVLLFAYYNLIKFEAIKNDRIYNEFISYHLKLISEKKQLSKIALMGRYLC